MKHNEPLFLKVISPQKEGAVLNKRHTWIFGVFLSRERSEWFRGRVACYTISRADDGADPICGGGKRAAFSAPRKNTARSEL